tara:strand:+ start:181 stop:348 length:168 start_codon:yes stop_codon:yes gene_type:complete
MDSKYQNRRAFLKKSGILIALFGVVSSFLKPGKYIFPKETDSDSAFIPRDPQNKI